MSQQTGSTRRRVWSWIFLGLGVVVVLGLGAALVWRMLHPPVVPYVESEGPRMVIQVNVMNASGVRGAGRTVLSFLRERGFDVVELSTSTTQQPVSTVIDRLGDRTSALKVASVLGIADSLVVSNIDSMLFVRASVVLGADVRQLEPFRE